MVYNNPVSYGVDITPEMFAELADEPKLVAIKESSENVRRITDLDEPRAATATSSSAASTTWCWRASCSARDGLGLGAGQRLPGREPPLWDLADGRPVGRGA